MVRLSFLYHPKNLLIFTRKQLQPQKITESTIFRPKSSNSQRNVYNIPKEFSLNWPINGGTPKYWEAFGRLIGTLAYLEFILIRTYFALKMTHIACNEKTA